MICARLCDGVRVRNTDFPHLWLFLYNTCFLRRLFGVEKGRQISELRPFGNVSKIHAARDSWQTSESGRHRLPVNVFVLVG